MQTSSPPTVLLCGCGSRGRTVFGRFIQSNPDLAWVVAVADPDEQRRNSAAREHEVTQERRFVHWRETVGGERLADIAIVATNDRDHLEPALAYLKAGYHLLLEKPMAPNLEDCRTIVEAARGTDAVCGVCHVLRYTPYFRKLRELLDSNAVGEVVTVRHLEPVNYWHFAHSFVRGNWRRSETTSPFMLAKCCHDMDILLYLVQKKPIRVQSFGSLLHFRPQSAPEGATDRCLDCPLMDDCAYSAPRFYGRMLQEGSHDWPLDVVLERFTEDALREALSQGPYGRCVYHSDNTVPDHQIVNLEFEGGATASLTATAFTEIPARRTEIFGTQGSLSGNGESIVWQDFRTRRKEQFAIEGGGGHHMGGDEVMLRQFLAAVTNGRPELVTTTPQVSLLSHEMALLAEESRLTGRVVAL